ncbi:MAG TPA: hypothetical protein DDZ51_25845 [Planctomycetaceae bacterium]|nr:hypothetical protein [Planctomycetaceae bacterium]
MAMTMGLCNSRLFKRLLFVGLACVALSPATANAQSAPVIPGLDVAPSNSYPNDQYFLALQVYREGDLLNAAAGFNQALGLTRKDSNGRWIDAIPVYAMLGECLYQAGDLPGAIENFDTALALTIRHRGWLGALTWNDLTSAQQRQPDMASAWAAPNIPMVYPLPNRLSISTGNMDLLTQARQGGAIESARLTRMDAVEVMRGVALALYRRKIIFGEISGEYEIAAQTLEAIRYPKDLNIPIARALIGSMRACGKFAAGDAEGLGSDIGEASLLPAGVHPLTPLILLSGARQAALGENYSAAVPLAIRAAAAASALGQPEWVGEALAVAAGCSEGNLARQVQIAATAAATAHQRRGPLATIGSLAAACDAAMTAGDVSAAAALLEQLRAILGRRDMQQPRWAAYGEYLTAIVAAGGGGSIGGDNLLIDDSITRILAFASGNNAGIRRNNTARRGRIAPATPRLYQLAMVNADNRSRGAIGRVVEQRLASYVAEPSASVWRNDPVDAIAYLSFDRSSLIADQISAAIKKNSPVDVLVNCDAFVRNRFLMALPLGGRVQQIRTIAATDQSLLGQPALDLLANPPTQLQGMMAILAAPVPAPGRAELFQRGRGLESLATQIALSRRPLPVAMPRPLADSKDLQRLPAGHAMLTYTEVGATLIATLTIGKDTKMWNVPLARQLPGDIAKLIKGIGAGGRNAASRLDEGAAWTVDAATIRRKLFPNEYLDSIDQIQHLVIVPDGQLWYLPFELLPVGDENATLMGDKISIRYAPTPGLAIHPTSIARLDQSIGTSAQLFFAPRDGNLNAVMVGRVIESIENHTVIPGEPAVASNQIGQTIGFYGVLGAITPDPLKPLMTNLSGYDTDPASSTLAAWMRLPSNLPRGIFLPGYRTAAGGSQLGDGRELFMTLTSLQVAGVRDVVISRWPVGGESTAILTKEFLQELPFDGIDPSWRRAIQTLRRTNLVPESEPLLGAKDQKRDELTGDHPLFWSGYMMVSPYSPPVDNQPPAINAAAPLAAVPPAPAAAAMPPAAAIPPAAAAMPPAAELVPVPPGDAAPRPVADEEETIPKDAQPSDAVPAADSDSKPIVVPPIDSPASDAR